MIKIAISVFMAITLLIVIVGVTLLATNEKLNKKYGNRLMAVRVTLQALIVILVACLYFVYA